MAKSTLFEQLDQVVEAILAQPERPLRAEGSLAPLARLARNLRGLPRENFKASLKADLEKEIAMTTAVESAATTKAAVEEHYQTLTPYIMHDRVPELADFLQQAFGADELSRSIGSAGGLHIETRIGDAMLMLGGG